jgi:type I restriction-modification system DNA methylase subunit
MWEKSHLPAVGPTPEGQRIPLNLPGRLFGMLNELEKAHIYIDQLNERIKDKDSQMDDLRERLARLEAAASKAQ